MKQPLKAGKFNAARVPRGFTYIAVLIFIAIMGVGLAATAEVWHMQLKRENEKQLLFAGDQFRTALIMYYVHAPGAGNRYPTKLEDLLKDPRYPATKRYLRKIYADPMTNSVQWGLLKGANGEILGVYSVSAGEPSKKANFSIADREFEGKTAYSDWVFVMPPKFLPAQPSGPTAPGKTQ